MIEIDIVPEDNKNSLKQILKSIGGELKEDWHQSCLTVDNHLAKGKITCMPFDWGVELIDFEIKFFDDVMIRTKTDTINPLCFMYNLRGHFTHRFGVNNEEKQVEHFHSLIFTNKAEGENFLHFPASEPLDINMIQIKRKDFLKKRTSNVSTLNKRLHEVFVDTDHELRFAHYGSLNLKLGDFIKKIKKTKGQGMVKSLKIEALVYEILSYHIQQHNTFSRGVPLPTSLSQSELKLIRSLGNKIIKEPSFDYSLDQLSSESGLSQAKLQEGFKFLYTRTVTEYVRHIRLQRARDLLNQANLNISEVVYSIGFTSRSYFSKIFKEKYAITPNEYRKKVLKNLVLEKVAV
ncbi:helix-turn-helix domain-containing protein [Subsaximicrobium wynnwilliamsii]|uniref:Helix-turn-helix domain-containing protein n=1 Tax=Subsaximicrobium wynnwilliamsii TaxID=291179 RepID=A0A5C6ZLS1_9FLAO|nr:helix-turn-helix domain-containing protein [Subsaximicrobium wynnwilliamsii]TXD85205.1 helix-turn-helix domain-containing protein [Subsaximicrobium wynnwilliamsii]TXD91248.1 helix-turn-helix domain-containing protein [Subsaximicrobium wynnwilliamsii]TXE04641.1 helix-turn-helix domain-containing protein [Subsaximicrobium wynnwilliamsii]